MLDHISISVTDLERSIAFYDATLAALGFVRVWTYAAAAGYGFANEDDRFAIKTEATPRLAHEQMHIAFAAKTRDAVARFHAVGIALGARDEGAPGLCPEYGAGYYASFLRDPDGYRLEAVLHEAAPR